MSFGQAVRGAALFLMLGSALEPAAAPASDWPRFRGPNGSGVSPDTAPAPVTWSPDENIRFKVPLAGAGVSSPMIVGGRVLVTS